MTDSTSTGEMEAKLAHCADALVAARHVVVLSGAGISKESGIPTFRDAQTGLWANYNPEDLATREGFLADPRLVWEWYDFRRNKVWATQPNAGHHALVKLEQLLAGRSPAVPLTIITQNIDNLHRQAGSTSVLELHGSIFRYKCLDAEHPVSPDFVQHAGMEDLPPKCPLCHSLVRPDVVWFGEMLPEGLLQQAFQAAGETDCMLVVGTSGVVHPAASLPGIARQNGATVIEINPEETVLTPSVVDCFLHGASGEILPRLIACLVARLDRERLQ